MFAHTHVSHLLYKTISGVSIQTRKKHHKHIINMPRAHFDAVGDLRIILVTLSRLTHKVSAATLKTFSQGGHRVVIGRSSIRESCDRFVREAQVHALYFERSDSDYMLVRVAFDVGISIVVALLMCRTVDHKTIDVETL